MKKLKGNTIKKLKPYWKRLQQLEDEFYGSVEILEKEMKSGLKMSNLEFIQGDSEYVGIGDTWATIQLIHAKELE